jgi:hypothetical protein
VCWTGPYGFAFLDIPLRAGSGCLKKQARCSEGALLVVKKYLFNLHCVMLRIFYLIKVRTTLVSAIKFRKTENVCSIYRV